MRIPLLLKTFFYLFLLSIIIFTNITNQVFAAPKAIYWAIWDKSNPGNTANINYEPWQHFLNRYLFEDKETGMRLVAYNRVSKKDKESLRHYLKRLTQLDPRDYSKAEQEAYWINLYNGLTVNLILQHYPVKSITTLGKGWFQFGPWNDTITKVIGIPITLNDIEHRILRPLWKDSRLHYALNCASKGCPDLAPVAYTAKNMNALLNTQAKRYINQPKGVYFKNGKLQLSSLYKWYRDDFGDKTALLKHLEHYARPPLKDQLEQFRGTPEYEYNWSLNEIK